MKKLSLKEIQECSLKELVVFDKYCTDRKIHYSLAAGTLIGAVRHKGFIPWDDDVDIFMNREDYDKFLQSLPESGYIDVNYKVLIPDHDEDYFYPFTKIVDVRTIVYEKNIKRKYAKGVWLDVFPIDGCAENCDDAEHECLRRKKLVINYLYYYTRFSGINPKKLCQRIYVLFINLCLKWRKDKIKNKLKKASGNAKSSYVSPLCWAMNSKEAYPREHMSDYIRLEFEGHMFSCYKEYDKILKHRYGNYMQIPPDNQRISHESEAYYIAD